MTVDGAHVYWSDLFTPGGGLGSGTIGQANLNGGSPNQSFIGSGAPPTFPGAVGPEGMGMIVTPIERVLQEGVTITKSEQMIENRTGGRIWTEVSYSPIFDDAGRITSGIAIIRNTSKDREVEEIKSDFISIVSHELRTPLTAIKGFLSMTLKQDFGPLSEKQYHYLSRVYQSNQRRVTGMVPRS